MARRASPKKQLAAKYIADPLAESVDRLTAELRVLRQVIVLEHSTFRARSTASPLDSDAIDRMAEELTQAFESVAEEQLEVVLIALDGVRAELVAALKRRPTENNDSPPPKPPSVSSPSGRLF